MAARRARWRSTSPAARDNYAPSLAEGRHGGRSLLELEAVLTPAWGTSARRREVILWQRVMKPAGILGLLTSEIPAEHRAPGHLDARRARRCATTGRAGCCAPSTWSPIA